MKKLIRSFFFLLTFFMCISVSGVSASCVYDGAGDVGSALDNCIWKNTQLVTASDYKVGGWFKSLIQKWTTTIAGVLGLFAVGAIVYGALLMTLSAWKDDMIKKWKDIVKWAIIWFIWVIAAGGLISVVVNFIFAVG